MDNENRAHDLAIAYLNYQLQIELSNTDPKHDKESFFGMYKSASDKFYEMLTHGM